MNIDIITKSELSKVMLDWANKEGWHYSSQDVESYFNMKGKVIYALKEKTDNTEHLIGCVCVTKYQNVKNEILASIGLLIINKDYRGQRKYGPFLLQKILENLRENKITAILLNSVSRTSFFYECNGFIKSKISNNHYSVNLDSISDLITTFDTSDINSVKQINYTEKKDEIMYYDRKLFGTIISGREEFMNTWFSRPDTIIHAYYNNEMLEGYAVLTTNQTNEQQGNNYRLAPMYSSSIDITRDILRSILIFAAKQKIDSIELNCHTLNNAENIQLLQEHGFTKDPSGVTYMMATMELMWNPQKNKIVALSPLEFPHEVILCDK